ncbi:MAG: CoA-binding protein [Marinilabiliales bacterium]|nr:MAG: CoA-binding protein [Marinilabiliales bacterium]
MEKQVYLKENIDKFMACKKFAVAGVSSKSYKTGSSIFRELKKKGYDIVPVSPNLDYFEEFRCYRSVSELPDDVEALIVATKPEQGISVIRDAEDKGIKNIFVQLGAHSNEIIEYGSRNELNLICKQCIFMFAQPTGIHKFHEKLAKLFGAYPKQRPEKSITVAGN